MNEREAPTPIGNVFCRGAIALGSGCMRCGRCAVQLAEKVKQLEAAALASAPAAEPVSPMAKMAQALRDKAAAEKASFDARVQSGEWGPAPEARTEADCQPQHVAQVEGDAAVRTLRWNKNVGAFEYPVGTKLYAASAPAQPAQPAAGVMPDGKLHADGYFTWNTGKRPEYIADRGLPCDFYIATPPTAQPAPQQGEAAQLRSALDELTSALRAQEQLREIKYLVSMPTRRTADQRVQAAWRALDVLAANHPAQPAEQAGEDAARWQMLPAVLEQHQINYMALLRDIDAARAAQAASSGGSRGK